MKYTDFKGYKVSQITLGTVQLGLNYGINNQGGQPDTETAGEILSTAIDGGITTFDTSSDYGTSEKVVGDYFKSSKEKPFIVTKCSVKDWDKVLPEKEVEKRLREQVERSLENLGYKKLPLLLLHDERDIDNYGKLLSRILKRFESENLIEKAGVSLNHFSYIDKVLESEIYRAVQLPLNMMDVKNATGNGIKKLANNNIAVFIRSVYLQGLFFRDPESLPQGILQNAKEPLKKMIKITEEENISISELAIGYIREIKGVISLVMGAEKPEQVKENISLICCKPLSEKTRERITETFNDIDERVLCPWLWNK